MDPIKFGRGKINNQGNTMEHNRPMPLDELLAELDRLITEVEQR